VANDNRYVSFYFGFYYGFVFACGVSVDFPRLPFRAKVLIKGGIEATLRHSFQESLVSILFVFSLR